VLIMHPTDDDFRNSLRFRVTLRRFMRWSEEQAGAVGRTPTQHQLLVSIKGHPGPEPPAIRELADALGNLLPGRDGQHHHEAAAER
jgi:hypothetical protein